MKKSILIFLAFYLAQMFPLVRGPIVEYLGKDLYNLGISRDAQTVAISFFNNGNVDILHNNANCSGFTFSQTHPSTNSCLYLSLI